MKNRNAIFGAGILLVAWTGMWAHATEIARWNSAGAVPQATNFPPLTNDANVTVADLVRGAGLGTGGSPGPNTFYAVGYNDSTTNTSAMTNGDYWVTAITPQAGKAVSYTNLNFRFRASSAGPKFGQWAYSIDGTNFTWIDPVFPVPTSYSVTTLGLSGVAGLQSCATKIWFRIAAWGATGATGVGAFGQSNDVIIFTGTIGSSGPVPPSVTFNPNGTTNAPVSNEFTMAVSITPAGAGMQSWNMLPAYSGPASLTGGNFSFTPYSADNGKTFTVSVIATNSVGTSTGTASIVVKPYVPPVPVITFSPTGTYSIMATYTQKLGIGLAPAGSGISSWTLLPSNYAGSVSVVGTNFTFIAAQADGPSNYTFTVIATNSFGPKTGSVDIAVTEYIAPPPPGSLVVDFEDAPNKTDYGLVTNTMNGRQWLFSGATSIEAGDKKFDTRAMRVRCNATDNEIKLCSFTPFTNGIESISLWFASYGNDGTNEMPQVSVQLSTNLNSGWVTLDTFDTASATQLVRRAIDVKVRQPVYFRLTAPTAGTGNRANIDNIILAPYVAPTGYDAYLLQYNVTPGDPGTAPDEDWDGDESSNTNEYDALTNPYDDASHP